MEEKLIARKIMTNMMSKETNELEGKNTPFPYFPNFKTLDKQSVSIDCCPPSGIVMYTIYSRPPNSLKRDQV